MSRLRECRERAGYSQKQIALILKVAAPSVSNWEKGKTRPSRDNLVKLADLYGVTVDYLMGRLDDAHEEPETESPEIQMTEAEYALSMRWRKLSDKGKRDVMNFIQYTETMEQDGNEEE